jgi:hypothetical protein
MHISVSQKQLSLSLSSSSLTHPFQLFLQYYKSNIYVTLLRLFIYVQLPLSIVSHIIW